MPNIKCGVGECQYNASDLCQASTIEVNSDMKDRITSYSRDTACETFIPKGKFVE